MWRHVGRALPLTSAIACAALVWRCVQAQDEPRASQRLVPFALWSVYALLLLIKVVLNVRISHYGFVLAMPATLLLVACLVWGVPAALAGAGKDGRLARALVVAAILAGVFHYQQWSRDLYARKNLPVGELGDAFLAGDADYEPRAHSMRTAFQHLRATMSADASLLVLPEGTMLNYWLRRSNPTRHTLFTPTALTFFGGEDHVLDEMKAAPPPDFIALVHANRDTFGVGYFGADSRYGARIMEWVRGNYVRLERIGAEPFRDDRFGIVLMRRR